jgi:hypothetical protein
MGVGRVTATKKRGQVVWAHPVTVLTVNCEDWAIQLPGQEWAHYTGPGAYDAVLTVLYLAGYTGAYYEAQNYWGPRCPYTAAHTCGLEKKEENK